MAIFPGFQRGRGTSKWLGFELVINFWTPYLAVSPSDFWRRWHISPLVMVAGLFIHPLGGNRHGAAAMYRNLMLTMFLLGGLWMVNWTFVLWGLYSWGVAVPVSGTGDPDPTARRRWAQTPRYWLLRVLLMFHLTCFGLLLFCADNFTAFAAMAQTLLTNFVWTPHATSMLAMILFYCAIPFAVEWLLDGENKIEQLAQSHWLGAARPMRT